MAQRQRLPVLCHRHDPSSAMRESDRLRPCPPLLRVFGAQLGGAGREGARSLGEGAQRRLPAARHEGVRWKVLSAPVRAEWLKASRLPHV